MRLTILAMGSRGDVEPFAALGQALQRRGHEVVLATHGEFAGLVGGAGLEFRELGGNPREALSSPDGQAMLRTRNPLLLPRRMGRLVGPATEEVFPAAEQACAGSDLVVLSTLAMVGVNVADRLGVPAVVAHLQPGTRTAAMPSTSLPALVPPPAALNRATWAVTDWLTWRAFRPTLAAQRRRLGLPSLRQRPPSRWPAGVRPPVLCGFSEAVVPRPADWPADVHVTGYWFRDADPGWAPQPELAAFLDAGPAPVHLGFGSMPDGDPVGLLRALVGGARRAGQRMLVHSGWSRLGEAGLGDPGMGEQADDLLVVDDVPHAWLFPRVTAVVHHGGAGTTAAALRAGVPAVVVPLFADQFFWARRVAELGAGSAPIAREDLTAERLGDALGDALAPSRRAAAESVAHRLATEDGPATAVTILEHYAR